LNVSTLPTPAGVSNFGASWSRLTGIALGSKNLVLITHGMDSNAGADSWARKMADNIYHKVLATVHEILRKWSARIGQTTTPLWRIRPRQVGRSRRLTGVTAPTPGLEPSQTTLSALERNWVRKIQSEGYRSVQLIAHSAGAWLIDAVADGLKDSGIDVHVTFLDAYVPIGWNVKPKLGDSATWAEQYESDDLDGP